MELLWYPDEHASGDTWTTLLQRFPGLADYWRHQEGFSNNTVQNPHRLLEFEPQV